MEKNIQQEVQEKVRRDRGRVGIVRLFRRPRVAAARLRPPRN